MTLRRYLVLAGVTFFASSGDSLLSYGMKQVGPVSVQHLPSMILAFLNPWVALGILLLLGFFACYTSALSWADLTYVLPATSVGYVLVAVIARFVLHEHIPTTRWLGILLISAGVGFVASGPSRTDMRHPNGLPKSIPEASEEPALLAGVGSSRAES
ncbi:MAG TPA: EamA family transporter [Terriglobales bacterium]|nr:EamA family transporter [Terriglobales bacterium]